MQYLKPFHDTIIPPTVAGLPFSSLEISGWLQSCPEITNKS